MNDVVPAGTLDLLGHLHAKLDRHFRALSDARAQLDPPSPVFALEHGLTDSELDLVSTAVRSAVRDGFPAAYRRPWLPLIVYAAEVGYGYVGDEYWPSFIEQTPGWDTNRNRPHFKSAFLRFADQYGGARPSGAWADWFPVICWPITHAVLPIYLQRQLAQLLFEYRTGLTTALLHDPDALGTRLAARTANYTERFRIFCQNTSLLGQIATALLLGDEDSPYLLAPTLHRLVAGLEAEQQSRVWLRDAKRFARQVRTTGLRPSATTPSARPRGERLPTPTDPRLLLRRESTGWTPFAALPDLTSLQTRLPQLFDELKSRRVLVNGSARKLPTGSLTYPNQEVRLTSWPSSGEPFLQLEGGSEPANKLLEDQCVVSLGPLWLFRVRPGAAALQVRGRFLRPGNSYCLIHPPDSKVPDLPWIRPGVLLAGDAQVAEIDVPGELNEREIAALNEAGLGTIADVQVRPVGLVPASWDGDGTAEWLVGDPAMLAIRSQRRPARCVLTIDATPYVLTWPDLSEELFVGLDGLAVGSHEIAFDLLDTSNTSLASGAFCAVFREPQTRTESASGGEGIRLLASPARPLLTELWDGRAEVTVQGPPQVPAELSAILRDARGSVVKQVHRNIQLPLAADSWARLARQWRDLDLGDSYDAAESCELSVWRNGVGFATLTCDRGFQPLRWILARRNRTRVAELIDRTDGDTTQIEYTPIAAPMTRQVCESTLVELPPLGGLLRATAGEATASIMLPPERNELRSLARVRPQVHAGPRTVNEATRLLLRHYDWSMADLPADPFARRQQHQVVEAITTCLVSLIAGSRWARIETSLDRERVLDRLDDLQALVGDSPKRKAPVAVEIATSLWKWADSPQARTGGFASALAPVASEVGLANRPDLAGFLLTLTSNPGRLAMWNPQDRSVLLEKVLRFPVLLRAARFTVLGCEAFSADTQGVEGQSA